MWRVRFSVRTELIAVAYGDLMQFLMVGDGVITGLVEKIEIIVNGFFVAGGLAAILERYFYT